MTPPSRWRFRIPASTPPGSAPSSPPRSARRCRTGKLAVYLLNPAKLTQSAHTLKLTLGLLIGVLLAAIGVGSWLIVADLNRQLTLARQKTDFVSNVSHELKTPLTSIRMFSELLAEGRVSDRAKQRSYLGIITAETARLTRLINNVLDFARIERGEKKYNFQKCDLVSVVRETADTYRPHLEANGFQFACELPDAPVFVNGDRDALAQVVVNLLSNAEKYSDSRKEIALQRPKPQARPLPSVEVKVLDRGMGVPKGCEEKIFEQFYRAHDSLSNGIQGSGLGLTLARQIARAHGGDVVYEPRDGGGSCFTLRLPVMPWQSRMNPERAASQRAGGSPPQPRMKTKVLIVEDDPHILLGLEEVLKSDGFEVAVCNRGDQAIEAVRKQRPALIVLDVMLPGLSGYDICKQLRAKKVATPILMLTAKGQEIDKVVGLDLGADDYVTKPFGVRELLARIHALLRRTAAAPASEPDAQAPFQIGAATIDPKTFQLKRGKDGRRTHRQRAEAAATLRRPPGRGLLPRPPAQRSLGLQLLRHHAHAGPGHRPIAQEARRQRRRTPTPPHRPRRRLQAGELAPGGLTPSVHQHEYRCLLCGLPVSTEIRPPGNASTASVLQLQA